MSHSTVADYFSSEQDFAQPISARFDNLLLIILETFKIRENKKSQKSRKKSRKLKNRKVEKSQNLTKIEK